jgi:hypothetical protein
LEFKLPLHVTSVLFTTVQVPRLEVQLPTNANKFAEGTDVKFTGKAPALAFVTVATTSTVLPGPKHVIGSPIVTLPGCTVTEVVTAAPGPLSLVVTVVELMIFKPGVVPLMPTATVQELFGATTPLLKLRLLDPLTAVNVPLQVLLLGRAATDVSIAKPAGNVALNATPVSVIEFGFVIV